MIVPLPVLGVVIPAHDEAELLGDCLEAVARAARWVSGRAVVRTLAVLDACADTTAEVASAHGVETLSVDVRCVGRARDAGCRELLDQRGPRPGWVATTDADSRVPPDWLLAQLEAWQRGADARVGAVYVDDWGDQGSGAQLWFRDVYDRAGDPHPHVHGANLGVSAEAYRRCGGFRGLPTGEDVALVDALGAGGFTVQRTRRSPVLTSARRVGRAADGFAGRLAELGSSASAEPARG
ncbi:glycosyltransferase family 2 protein [Actinomycetospora endophytica]|uniref:4,4'-diaponeurosporenoate glycosyltransferase n=1 Tax=Actinomycetospora endophytica TaxID=2291215 RepID=A0ABS8PH96_9PSEU|nr:glycosyltransferase family A protein [Actinomycetospora endophytica]MCD2197628.1 glycosyltransferase family 2 protein [Actinomycetospora endophytica]